MLTHKNIIPPYLICFHGCSADKAAYIKHFGFPPSSGGNDWLSSGVYFWQDDFGLAHKWAEKRIEEDKKRREKESKKRSPEPSKPTKLSQALDEFHLIKGEIFQEEMDKPIVLCSIIKVGNILDFCDSDSSKMLKNTYDLLLKRAKKDIDNISQHLKQLRKRGEDLTELFRFVQPEDMLPKNEGESHPLDDMVIRTLVKKIDQLHKGAFLKLDSEPPKIQMLRGFFFEGKSAFGGSAILKNSHIQIAVIKKTKFESDRALGIMDTFELSHNALKKACDSYKLEYIDGCVMREYEIPKILMEKYAFVKQRLGG